MSRKRGGNNKGAFDAKKFERPGLSADEIEEIKEAFDLFDSDESGSISVSELTAAMRSLGFDTKNAVVYRMIEEMDADGNYFFLLTTLLHLLDQFTSS